MISTETEESLVLRPCTSGVAQSNGTQLYYECFGDSSNPAVLLVTGMAVQSIYWPLEMCQAIIDAGYYLIRFDNRDSGKSSYTEGTPKGLLRHIISSKVGRRTRIREQAYYDLDVLVLDSVGILDELGIAAAHWVGFSMGGMIAQLAAADHGERVLSLASIMSSTNGQELPMPDAKALASLFPRRKKHGESVSKVERRIVRALDAMSGTTHVVPRELKEDYARESLARGMNPAGSQHHLMAMMATGGFAERLGKVTAPTLIIHGAADPLVHLKGGKHSAECISDARLEVIPGMGHEFPPSLYKRLSDSIIGNFPAATASSKVESSPPDEVPDVEVLIAGAGFSGLGIAIKLKEAGLRDFLILERANEVGGTWRDNTYPGCACDVQSHLYSYSFETKADWSRKYAGWKEIGQYLRNCAEKYDLYSHIKFGVEWKGAQYDKKAGLWRVQVSGGKLISARALVMAVGPLSNPAIPDIAGLDEFRGQRFHSATWEHDYDLSGKKVAVIGTGASAIQFVPEIAKTVSKLSLFQRTPAWVLSKEDRSFRPREIRRFQRSPAFHQAYRSRIYWRSEFLFRALANPESRINRMAEKRGLENLHKHVKDKALREALTPDYPIGCKRVLLSDNYYPSLVRDNVDLVTTGIEKISTGGIHDVKGGFHPVDAIIFGTGFTASDPLGGLSLRGREGQCLREVWKSNDYQSYLGIVAHGFPNMFLMTGPNTGLGHTSIVVMIEAQANYIIQALKHLSRGVVRSLEVRTDVQEKFSTEVQDKLQGTVWTSGCSSWYQAASGKNFAIWPDYTFRYRERCEQLNMSDYIVSSQPDFEASI